ncbi:MAG: peptidylprolyl isomerase [Candidatus Cloacimonetes bacterium]|nr:peptidylprolyl isomerase [Candidatus Cloacimonadota bacterium]
MSRIFLMITLILVTGGMMLLEAKNPIVEMKTNHGVIKLELFQESAPVTVENFLKYVNDGFFDGLVFHRVISNFMIQGGGFDQEGNQKKATYPAIKNEADNGIKNDRGTIAMARTSIVNSATCQFFINVKDNPSLNFTSKTLAGYGYAVFGKVIEGMETVDKIRYLKTGIDKRTGMRDWPVDEAIIISAKVVEK